MLFYLHDDLTPDMNGLQPIEPWPYDLQPYTVPLCPQQDQTRAESISATKNLEES